LKRQVSELRDDSSGQKSPSPCGNRLSLFLPSRVTQGIADTADYRFETRYDEPPWAAFILDHQPSLEFAGGAAMGILLLLAVLACPPGERLIDLEGKIPSNLKVLYLVVTLKPFYARLYIYPVGSPKDFLPCCGNKSTSVIRLPIGEGRFCVRQSQPQVEWHIRGLLRPDIEI
jgi:hypothetical protein